VSHPSYLALDRHALGETSPAVAAHLENCEACRLHLQSVRDPVEVPAWLDEEVPARSRSWMPMVALLAAGALAFVQFAPEPYVEQKGDPVVSVYVLHDGDVSTWDGGTVKVGDSLRLGIVPGGYSHVSVRSQGRVLYADALDGRGEILLPASWRVDAEGRSETLLVVLDDDPIPPGPLDSDAWRETLILTKEVQP